MEHAEKHNQKAVHRHEDEISALRWAALESPAVTDPAARAAAFKNDALPSPLGQYVAKVHGESYRITDGEVEALLAAGYSQDAVFEMTVAAALGAAIQRLEAGLRALREAR